MITKNAEEIYCSKLLACCLDERRQISNEMKRQRIHCVETKGSCDSSMYVLTTHFEVIRRENILVSHYFISPT
jgi:hypothetical protein